MITSLGVLPTPENAEHCEFASVTMLAVPHLKDEVLRHNVLQSLKRVKRVRKFNLGDGQKTYVATSVDLPLFMRPRPRLMVVDLTKEECGLTYKQVDLTADDWGREQASITEVQNFGSESADLEAKHLLVMNNVTNLVFGRELHSQPGRQISWESRKAWLGLEDEGLVSRYTSPITEHGSGGEFMWHFLPDSHR